jgi:hypothetical protein
VQARRDNRQVAGVDLVQNALTDAVVRNGVAVEAVFFELSAFGGAITVVFQRELHVEVALERVVRAFASAAREFETFVTDLGHHLEKFFGRKVAVLSGKDRNRSGHNRSSNDCNIFFNIVTTSRTKSGVNLPLFFRLLAFYQKERRIANVFFIFSQKNSFFRRLDRLQRFWTTSTFFKRRSILFSYAAPIGRRFA